MFLYGLGSRRLQDSRAGTIAALDPPVFIPRGKQLSRRDRVRSGDGERATMDCTANVTKEGGSPLDGGMPLICGQPPPCHPSQTASGQKRKRQLRLVLNSTIKLKLKQQQPPRATAPTGLPVPAFRQQPTASPVSKYQWLSNTARPFLGAWRRSVARARNACRLSRLVSCSLQTHRELVPQAVKLLPEGACAKKIARRVNPLFPAER